MLTRAAAAFAATVSTLSLAGCAQPDHDDAVVDGITALRDAGTADKNLGSMTTFEWDEVYLFPENTAVDDIQAKTGVELPGGLISGDRLYNSTLVFLGDGVVVETVQTAGAPLGFDSSRTFKPYPYPGELEVRDAAVYLVPVG